jgi:hypothetical protein
VGFSFAHAALAQQVVRCEGSTGQVIYANSACPAGTRAVRTIEPVKAPSDNDKRAAQARADHDAKELARIDREHKQAEQKADHRTRTAATAKANAKARECAKLERKVRDAQDEASRAALSKRDAAERKVKRAQETLDTQCA